MRKKRLGNRLANIFLILVSIIMLGPILIVVNIALKSNTEFLRTPLTIVEKVNWHNFAMAWTQAEMGIYFKNSIIYALVTAIGTCVVAAMAAYPIARNHFRGSNIIFILFLSALFLPVGLVPLIFIMKYLGFMNTYYGFILLKIGSSLSIASFILVGFVKGIPRELDEAAAIDGCGYVRYIFSILMPLMKPALFTVGMLTGITTWNDFINPFLFMTQKEMRPLTSGLYMFFGQYSTNWTILAAGIIVVAAPLMITYFFLQRFIISGVTNGALKG